MEQYVLVGSKLIHMKKSIEGLISLEVELSDVVAVRLGASTALSGVAAEHQYSIVSL